MRTVVDLRIRQSGVWLALLLLVATLPAAAQSPLVPELPERYRGEYEALSWQALTSFAYETPFPGELADLSGEELAARNEQIPTALRALDGRKVAVHGWLVPGSVVEGRVRSFLIAAQNDMGCCFGVGIGLNEWVVASVPDQVEMEMKPLSRGTVLGRFGVGERVERGTVLSVYRIEAEHLLLETP